MGNSVSCFDPIREHPPYSWPKDHPDRAAAIAEKKRQRRHQKIVGTQGNARTTSVASPQEAEAVENNTKEAVNEHLKTQDEKPIELDKPEQAETMPPVVAPKGIQEDQAEQTDIPTDDVVPEVEKIDVDEEKEEIDKEQIEPLDVTSGAVVNNSEQSEQPMKNAGEEDIEAQIEEEALDDITRAMPITNDTAAKEQNIEANGILRDDDKEIEEAAKLEAEAEIEAEMQAAPEPEPEKGIDLIAVVDVVDKEEKTEAETEAEKEADTELFVDAVDTEEETEPVAEDTVQPEGPSILKRRAMFEQDSEELPQAKETVKDVHDPVTGEYITLTEYRRRQMERAEGLVKERVEQYEDVDEAAAKEIAEFAAIEAVRTEAIEKTRWKFKNEVGKTDKTFGVVGMDEKTGSVAAVDEETGNVIVMDEKTGDVAVVDRDTGDIVVMDEKSGDVIVVDEDTGDVAVVDDKTGDIAVVDGKTGDVVVMDEKTGDMATVTVDVDDNNTTKIEQAL